MKSKKNLIILAIVIAISLIGVTYAFFDYYMIGSNQKITAGKVNLVFNEGEDTIDRGNIFPETVEKARSRKDNFITFTVSGVNTTEDQDIYYEIMLNEGDTETGMTRFNPEDLVFDLIEVNGTTETYLVNAMSFSDFNARRIWVNTIDSGTSTTKSRTYKLRMWLSEDVLISDSNPNADYPSTGYENYYASVKISVYGDFKEKYISNYMVNLSNVTEITNQKVNITEVNFISLPTDEINTRYTASAIKADVTDTTKTGGSVKAWLETDTNNTSKYIMYVASNGTTYFPSDCTGFFNGYSSVINFNFENVDTSNITNTYQMFLSCAGLISIDLSNWNMSSLSEGRMMFTGCSSLNYINMDNWDLTSLNGSYGLANMFNGCPSLTSLKIDGWKLDDTIRFLPMIAGSKIGIEGTLELTNFDLSESTTTASMFENYNILTSLKISSWDTSNITDMSNMFTGCLKLTNLDISSFTFNSVTTTTSMFKNMPDTANVIVGGTTQQNWILELATTDRPEAWTTSNVVVKQ